MPQPRRLAGTTLRRDERGFTLPELLVVIMVMVMVLFALYNIFDMSIKVFAYGNDKVEAVENARLGLEKMEREVRAAYPVNGPTISPRYRFFNANNTTPSPPAQMPTASQITFGNELGAAGDGIIQCPAGGTCEYITYNLRGSAPPGSPLPACTEATAPCTLRRVNAASSTGAGDPVVEFVAPPNATNPNRYGLRFTYLQSDGVTVVPPGSGTQSLVSIVRIELQIDTNGAAAGGGTQTLSTDVDLRN